MCPPLLQMARCATIALSAQAGVSAAAAPSGSGLAAGAPPPAAPAPGSQSPGAACARCAASARISAFKPCSPTMHADQAQQAVCYSNPSLQNSTS